MQMRHRGTERRQLRETRNKIFQTGVNQPLSGGLVEGELGFPVSFGDAVHRDPRMNLEGNTTSSFYFRKNAQCDFCRNKNHKLHAD